MKFDLGRVENIVGKGEKADDQHFPLFFHKGDSTLLQTITIVSAK